MFDTPKARMLGFTAIQWVNERLNYAHVLAVLLAALMVGIGGQSVLGQPNSYLRWTGKAGDDLWNLTSSNWTDIETGGEREFSDGDGVLFDSRLMPDSSQTRTIDIDADNVNVAGMTVLGGGHWIFNGNITGVLHNQGTSLPDATGGLTIGDAESDATLKVTLNGDNIFSTVTMNHGATLAGIGGTRITAAGNVNNSGTVENIDELKIIGNLVNIGARDSQDRFTGGIIRNVERLTVGDGDVNARIFNSGVFLNVRDIEVVRNFDEPVGFIHFENRPGSVLGGTRNLNLNGGTFANNGGIIIAGDARFDESGTPEFAGIGTLNIEGNLVSTGGLFVIGLNDNGRNNTPVPGTTHCVINVSGTATIDGGFVDIIADRDRHYVATDSQYRYVFLNAREGLSVPNELLPTLVTRVDDPLLVARARHGFNADEDVWEYWFFLERRHLYSGEGETMNQRALGRYLDQVGIFPNGDYRNVLLALDHARIGDDAVIPTPSGTTVSDSGIAFTAVETRSAFKCDPIPRALEQMCGAIYGTMTAASFQSSVMMHATLTNVIRRDYNDVGGEWDQIRRGQTPQRRLYGNRGIYNPTNNLWGMLYGHAGVMHSDGNDGKYSQGFFGIMAGFDRINEQKRRMGMFLSLGEGSLSGEVQNRTLTRELMAGHYFRQDFANSYVLTQIGIGTHRYDTKRRIAFGGVGYCPNDKKLVIYDVDRTARNTHNSLMLTMHSEVGLRHHGGILNISPFVGTQYTVLVREGFTERGAGSLNLTSDMQTFDSARIIFGMRFDSEAFRWQRGLASFYGNAAWMYEFRPSGRRHNEFTANFSDAGMLTGVPSFTVHGNNPGRDWIQAGWGVKYDIHAHLRMSLGYNAYANTRQVMHSGNLTFVWEL